MYYTMLSGCCLVIVASLCYIGMYHARRDKDDFDYFILSMQWDHQDHAFTIHGWWPDNLDGTYPAFCREETAYDFDDKDLDPILDRLQKDWPSNIHHSDYTFWRHEVKKHGSCCQKQFPDPVTYLNHTMNVFESVKDGLFPGQEHMQASEVCSWIRDHTGTYPTFQCRHMFGTCLMKETWLCFDKQLQAIDCPRHKTACRNFEIMY